MESETYTVVTSDAGGAEMLLYKYFPTHGMSFLPVRQRWRWRQRPAAGEK